MATKYLDYEGLKTVWSKVKEKDSSVLASAKSYADTQIATAREQLNETIQSNIDDITGGQTIAAHATAADSATKATNDGDGNEIKSTYIKVSQKGVNGGVATIGADGKIPSSQLPSYVDDVLEYEKLASFPTTGEAGKIYTAIDTGKIYRWSGSTYTEISSSLSLGETSSTAYSGASGKQNRTDINTLQGYFSNGVANRAKYWGEANGTAYQVGTFTAVLESVKTLNKYSVPNISGDSTYYCTFSNTSGEFDVTVTKGNTNPITQGEVIIAHDGITLNNNTGVYLESGNASFEFESTTATLTTGTLSIAASTKVSIVSPNGVSVDGALSCSSLSVGGSTAVTAANFSSYATPITSAELTSLLV